MSSPEQFDNIRHSLIGLTERADRYVMELSQDADFANCFGTSLVEIKRTLSILKDNIFPIALFAKIQSGKSTTTAAMADGREITPCSKGGGGLRTSTVPVTIYNDDNVQEVEINGVRTTPVKINLYSEQDLVQCIIDAASGNLVNNESSSYNLDNSKDKEILKAAIELEIEIYKRILENYKNVKNNSENEQKSYPTTKLATLREAILILAFYGSDAHKKLRAGRFSTIAGMQSFLKTDSWETRWEKLAYCGFNETAAQFTAEESLHVFVESIEVPVKSDFMKKTGTSVTDAPGIMANARDTERAHKAARESAAIVFVLNGDRQFTEEERAQLGDLRETEMAEKVVFVLNFKDRTPENIKGVGIEKNILSVLNQEGFSAPHHQDILYCSSYLAKLAFIGDMIAKDKLDKLSEKRLLEDVIARWPPKSESDKKKKIYYSSPKEAWVKLTKKTLETIDNDELADEVNLDILTPNNEILQQIRTVSRWDQMIFKLRAHILKNRAIGVLLDMGATPVVVALERMEQVLKEREEETEKNHRILRAKYEAAKKILEEFSTQAYDILTEKFTDEIDRALADDCYKEVVLGSVNEAAKVAAPEIYETTSISSNIGSALSWVGNGIANVFRSKSKQKVHVDIKQRCVNIFSGHYKEIVKKKGMAWSENLENSIVYDRNVRRTVTSVQGELQRIWERLKAQNEDLWNNEFVINIKPVSSNLTGSIKRDVRLSSDIIGDMDTAAHAKFTALSIAGGLAFSMAASFVLFSIPIIGQILAIVAAIGYMIATDEKKQQNIDELAKKLANSLRGKLSEESTRDETEDGLINGQVAQYSWESTKPGLKVIREFYEQLFQATIEQQKNNLDASYKRAKAILDLNEDERKRIRVKASEWRTKKIAPLREDTAKIKQKIIENFEGET